MVEWCYKIKRICEKDCVAYLEKPMIVELPNGSKIETNCGSYYASLKHVEEKHRMTSELVKQLSGMSTTLKNIEGKIKNQD